MSVSAVNELRIGPYTLKGRLLLAPMAGVTDRPFRQLCRQLGAGLATSEMVSCNPRLRSSTKTMRRMDHAGEDEPRAVQIAGAEPAMMADAARYNVDEGAQIIDINMGCPAKKVCNVLAGSALLRDERLVGRILEAVVGAVQVPVTLKIRTGWDPSHRNGPRIARIAEAAGVAALAIHGRTRACGFAGRAEYDTIAAIKADVSIPIIANGDIRDPEGAAQALRRTGADALMIGRAAQGNPWVFREIAYYLDTGSMLAPPTPGEVRETMLTHLRNLYAFYGEYTGVRVARKHVGWYLKNIRGGELLRRSMNRSELAAQQLAMTANFFDRLAVGGMAA